MNESFPYWILWLIIVFGLIATRPWSMVGYWTEGPDYFDPERDFWLHRLNYPQLQTVVMVRAALTCFVAVGAIWYLDTMLQLFYA